MTRPIWASYFLFIIKMKRTDFHYDLPKNLIAQFPTKERTESRLLEVNKRSKSITDKSFKDIEAILQTGDLLVLNNTKVIPARLFGKKETGGSVEILLERVVDEHNVLAQVRASKSPKPGTMIVFDNDIKAEVSGRQESFFELRFEGERSVLDLMDEIGHIPLPPYIERADEVDDVGRYQTVYAEQPGAVAAPTAGLHFDEALLRRLKDKGVEQVFVTLHVGAGTYQPVRVENISEHKMHEEWVSVSQDVVDKIQQTKEAGHKVYAVGTTSVRSLESAALAGELKAFEGETDIFITPGFEFKVIDGLLTNFHLPESTLLMLVCALGGYELMMSAYEHAVVQEYRFFSYGDAMLIC